MPQVPPRLSVIMPVLDEAEGIVEHLAALAGLRTRGAEIIVVDGGSKDETRARAAPYADLVIAAPRGRASQMNAGAGLATGDVFLFLHADTRLPADADRFVFDAVRAGAHWGRFDVRIAGRSLLLPLVGTMMNLRSRATGIATGDQAIFVSRAAFNAVGSFPEQPLMEDIEMSRRLKRLGRPACLSAKAVTSGRRWDENGAILTILMMWRLRLAYWRGADPTALARAYGYRPRDANDRA